jgi:ribosomal protein S13
MASRTPKQPVYDELVKVTHVYLGPAADRFIARQVENHLNKSVAQLSRDDLGELVDWIKAVVSLLTEDSEIIEEYISELRKLSISPGARHGRSK